MSLRTIFFIALSFILAQGALAQARSCTEVRLDQPAQNGQPAGLLSTVPVMDQDGTDTCYAYVAAQMVDAYRFQSPEANRTHITSPLAAAVAFARENGAESVEGGSVGAAMKSIFSYGSCSYAKVGDQFGAYNLGGFLKGLKAYFDSVGRSGKDSSITNSLACYLSERDFLSPQSDMGGIETMLSQQNFTDFLLSGLQQVCKSNTVRLNKKPELESYLSEDLPDPKARKAKYLSIMDKIQTPRSLPVALYFCQDLLTNKDLMGIKRSGEMKDGCTLHTGIMVGRRRNATGGCDVLIRNSWGASCSGYDWNCERGQVWVDEDRLLDNMAAMVSYP